MPALINLPNSITLFRIALVIPLYLVLAIAGTGWWPVVLFLGAGLLDMLDGKVARHFGQSSKFGASLDLLGDHLLLLSAVGGLLAAGAVSPLAGWVGLLLVARRAIVALIEDTLSEQGPLMPSSLEHPKIIASFIGLALAMGPRLVPPSWPVQQTALSDGLLLIAGALTLVTLCQYTIQARKNPH